MKLNKVIIALLFFIVGNANSAILVDEVVRVIDGDTFVVNIHLLPKFIGMNRSIRLYGADTPELRGKCPKEKKLAREAKIELLRLLRNDPIVILRNERLGTFSRIVADVSINGLDLKDHLIDNGFAVRYVKNKPHDWCK